MIELKWNWAYYPYLDPPENQKESARYAGYVKVVNKDEADKVIAKLEKENERLKKQSSCTFSDDCLRVRLLKADYKEACDRLQTANLIKDEQLAATRHSKRKRCLAMANWCCDACDKWMMRKAKAIVLGKDGVKEYYQTKRKLFLFMRWQTRWLKIAEQFKEAK